MPPELLEAIRSYEPTAAQTQEQEQLGFDDGWNNRPAQYDDSEDARVFQAYMRGYRRGKDQSDAYDRMCESDR